MSKNGNSGDININKTAIILTYNAKSTIERAILSCNAIDEITEIIVSDDGSTDGTIEIIKKIQRKYLTVTALFDEHSGVKSISERILKCVTTAKNEYIILLGGDDYLLPSEKSRDYWSNCPENIIVCNGYNFNKNTNKYDSIKITFLSRLIKLRASYITLLIATAKPPRFLIQGAIINRKIFDFYRSDLLADDWQILMICIYNKLDIQFSDAIIFVHETGIENQGRDYKTQDIRWRQIIDTYGLWYLRPVMHLYRRLTYLKITLIKRLK